MDSIYLGVVPATLMALYLIAQRVHDAWTERVGKQRARYNAAEEALLTALEEMRKEVRVGTCPQCRVPSVLAVIRAHDELAEAARPRRAFVPEFSRREAFDLLEPINDPAERPF